MRGPNENKQQNVTCLVKAQKIVAGLQHKRDIVETKRERGQVGQGRAGANDRARCLGRAVGASTDNGSLFSSIFFFFFFFVTHKNIYANI